MNYLTKLTSFFEKYASGLRYGERTRPLRDWWIIISVALVLLIASAGWSYWIFITTSNAQDVAQATATQQVKTNSLDAVKAIFSARASEKSHYLNDYRFVDPSH